MPNGREKRATSRLSGSREDYVKALYALGGVERVVGTRLLAQRVGVRPPSATLMLRRLARLRLVVLVPGVGARLGAKGRREALRLIRRHRILETFLVRVLGLDWSDCHEDAEILEHHVSDRVLDAIDRLLGTPAFDPHGHPIPDADGHVVVRELIPLEQLAVGVAATIAEIRDEDRGRMAHWEEAGLVPGARVRVRVHRPDDDVFVIDVSGNEIVTGSEGLRGVLVQRGAR
jgi:DtxR family Mn-dependent transcriptional regulator